MEENLQNISPIDGRYSKIVTSLKIFFSEYGLIKYRVTIEVKYLLYFLSTIDISISQIEKERITRIETDFTHKDAQRIKEIETTTRHDVKAVEYFIREKLNKFKLSKYSSYIHIGLTSEDTNNLSFALMLKGSYEIVMKNEFENLINSLKTLALKNKDAVLLARTHGQIAVPTTFGKECANYVQRLRRQNQKLQMFAFEGKLNGAVGNHSALSFVYPNIDWVEVSSKFILSLGLLPNVYTTQILPYDNWIEYFQSLFLINGILIGFSQDIWQYIMLGYLTHKSAKNQIGSSTMPQKINPIDFENAEGNLQVANSLFELYQRKLPVSRLQRDLSDSTVKRTFGTSLAHTLLGWKSIIRGLSKITINHQLIHHELDSHWEVLAEGVQTYLRSVGDEKGYEKLMSRVKGKALKEKEFKAILKELKLDKKLKDLRPEKYVGYAERLTKLIK